MEDKRNEPRIVRLFREHGTNLHAADGEQYQGDCPFCNRVEKFRVNSTNGLWDCKVCGCSGNINRFLKEVCIQNENHLVGIKARKLTQDRNLKLTTLKRFGVGYNLNTRVYSVPCNGNPTQITTNVHRYDLNGKSKRRNVGTTCGKHSLIAPVKQLTNDTVKPVYLMEGEWDCMSMFQQLQVHKIQAQVYAVPGALIFPKSCVDLFFSKDVIVIFDNDNAGERGMVKVNAMLDGIVNSIKFINWPEGLPNGYDFRDLCRDKLNPLKWLKIHLTEALQTSTDVTPENFNKASAKNNTPSKIKTTQELQQLKNKKPCISSKIVFKKYTENLHMLTPEPLEVMFGTVLANRIQGDPLWMFLVAPPGGMKTELLMSLNTCPLITTTTSITPHTLVSGGNIANGGGDPSLVPKLDERVLVIKDFTTIMSMNSTAKDEIFGILRDAYDGKTEKQFGNGICRSYESRFGILAGVTPAIEQFNSNSVLGERFLKYRMKGSSNSSRNAIKQALKNIGGENSIRDNLIKTAYRVLNRDVTSIPKLTDEAVERITLLAQLVARLRGVVSREKYTNQVTSKPCSEVGTRLAKQLAKLAIGISLYKRESIISDTTYNTITKVAIDTAPDRVEEVVKQLFINEPNEWKSTAQISELVKFPQDTVRFVLQDLMLLKIIIKKKGVRGDWRLSGRIIKLMEKLKLYGRVKRCKSLKKY